MIEFEEYLKLGNELEYENNILMACAAYLEAIKNSTDEQKRTVENYVKILAEKVSDDVTERNQQLKQKLIEWKDKGIVSYAVKCFDNICSNMNGERWIDSDNAILYRCFKVCDFEEKYHIVSLDIKNQDLEELKKWYYFLKFMIRRVDMDLYNEKEIVEYIKKEKISTLAIYYISSTMCFHVDRTYQNFAKMFAKYAMKEYEVFFENLNTEERTSEKRINEERTSEEKELYPYLCENKTVTKEKVAFIIAVNEEVLYEEAVYYIKHLKIPTYIDIEIIPIRDALSATSAYNKGMKMTNAKYKVYMHQDVMIVNPYMIYEIMDIFQNKEIGMIGVAGALKMPESGIWWDTNERYMRILQDSLMYGGISDFGNFTDDYAIVEAIDGVIMITQYDIEWREDIFDGWHFYDISQFMEFNRKNFKVAVAAQKKIWCLHEQKANKEYMDDYMIERKKYFDEYTQKKD